MEWRAVPPAVTTAGGSAATASQVGGGTVTGIVGYLGIVARANLLFRGPFTCDLAQFVDIATLEVGGNEQRNMGHFLHGGIEGDQLAARLGIAILVFDQDTADLIVLKHSAGIGSDASTIKFNNHHLPKFLIQAHLLNYFLC